jgi:hypothetical protein
MSINSGKNGIRGSLEPLRALSLSLRASSPLSLRGAERRGNLIAIIKEGPSLKNPNQHPYSLSRLVHCLSLSLSVYLYLSLIIYIYNAYAYAWKRGYGGETSHAMRTLSATSVVRGLSLVSEGPGES